MKRFLPILLLAGCALGYDSGEYNYVVKTQYFIQQVQLGCERPTTTVSDIEQAQINSELALLYSSGFKGNDAVVKAETLLVKDIHQLRDHALVMSTAYCKDKTEGLNTALDFLRTTLGSNR